MGHNIKMREPFTWQTNIKSLYDKIRGIRSVEGLGDEEYLAIFTNTNFSTFTTDALDITEAGYTHAFIPAKCYAEENLDSGKTYRVSFDFTLNSGSGVNYTVAADLGLSIGITLHENLGSTGTKTYDFTGADYHGFNCLTANFAIANLSLKEVL